ncbi:MAG: DegT/DnrJ/EryC1/StrS family aminotransferase [Candidatus Brocadiia bacterium]
MLRVGQKEVDAIARVLLSGKVFRYNIGGECARFERRYAKFLGVEHAWMTSSGTAALSAALGGLGIGPGDEVLVPACTYMATAIAVLAVGAIPVVVDIDESITIDPQAVADAAGARTRAAIPVHMWGLPCDMDPLLEAAEERGLLVVEDACQAIGGAYRGRMLGSIGHTGAFSFNYYKHMTCGEGGAVVTSDPQAAERARCMIDCCNFYWTGRQDGVAPFASDGARASELEGAMMNAQLDRLPAMVRRMRREKQRILRETAHTALRPIPANDLEGECGSHVMFTLPTAEAAQRFAGMAGGTVCGQTGRHVYTEWDPVLAHQGAHHPALNPYNLPQNRRCRKKYSKQMCARSLDILARTVMIRTHPDHKRPDVTRIIRTIEDAASQALVPAQAAS